MFKIGLYTKRSLLLANAVLVVVFAASYLRLPPQLPLWYSRISGESQVAPWWMIGVLPLLMNVFVVMNVLLQRKFFPHHDFMQLLVRIVNSAIIATCMFIFIKILWLVVV